MDAEKHYHHGDLKNLLITKVLEAVKNNYFEKFSIREAARYLDVSPAAPYNHFNDKNIKSIIFDAYGKLFDVNSVAKKM